ncbi:hypothetical protein ONZ51_g7014 [Trametes cubensis]|uniref:Uncharacterized protein n=1 Tax=Trametes cubensis TaxID=1111947 RepID=A0AAD7TS40_9APHY|nr:hypothetical protein ONZ51_g7014 [Trametes cubensis]
MRQDCNTSCSLRRLTWLSSQALILLLPALCHADPVNVTVDDTSSLIVYTPASSWHASSVPCSSCLAPSPDIAYQGTWHDGTHIIPTVDQDDLPTSGQSAGQDNAGEDDDDGANENGDGNGDKHKGEDADDEARKKKRWHAYVSGGHTALRRQAPDSDPTNNPFFTPHFDSDDAGFVDHPVSAEFNFTGSAIFVYALVPLAAVHANSTPTFMNLTFFLDSHPSGIYQHTGTPSGSGFLPSQLVFSKRDLTNEAHSLSIQVGPDSVLLLDYIVYTQGMSNGAGTSMNGTHSSASSTPGAQETGSGTGSRAPSGGPGTASFSMSQAKSRNNIATFAGAVGGSVGLLAVLALSLAISIYRRRMRAARRDRQLRTQNRSHSDFDSESFHTDASEDSPPMQGPAPFVPRYFPGTVVPAPPPPYSPPSEQTTALLAAASPVSSPLWAPPRLPAHGEDISYADQPPPTPPPLPEDGLDDYFAPPSFQVAISSPIPAILAGYSPVPTSSPPVSSTPVPRLSNGPESRGVYATVPPTSRSRANSDAQSQRSDWSDRPPSFASQAPPLIPLPPQEQERQSLHGSQGVAGSQSIPQTPSTPQVQNQGQAQVQGQVQGQGGVQEQMQEQRTSDGDRHSVRSVRSARSR